MITIAHRLNTVMHSDLILVLDKGRVVEYDTPSSLQASRGVFSAMLAQAQASHRARQESAGEGNKSSSDEDLIIDEEEENSIAVHNSD